MKNKIQINANMFETAQEFAAVIEDLGVFSFDFGNSKDVVLVFDQDGHCDNIDQDVKISLNADIAFSKARFKELCDIMPKNNRGYMIKNDASIRIAAMQRFYDFSVAATKRSNEYHKEVLENRLNGLYKNKYRDGKIWNEGGHKA